MNRNVEHRKAQNRMAKKSTATRYADSLSRHIELKDSIAMKGKEPQPNAPRRIALQGTATRRAPWKQDAFRVERLE